MPVRDKAIDTAWHALTLYSATDSYFINRPTNPIAVINGVEMPKEEFHEQYITPLERVYERVVDSIDWNRVMIEAQARHLALGHDTEGDRHSFPFTEDICPKCLCEALLAEETHTDWKREPDIPRRFK